MGNDLAAGRVQVPNFRAIDQRIPEQMHQHMHRERETGTGIIIKTEARWLNGFIECYAQRNTLKQLAYKMIAQTAFAHCFVADDSCNEGSVINKQLWALG